jgi:pimeloyl-ACP methyl ester carboxylesterase
MAVTWIDRMAVDVSGPEDAEPIVLVHGLGGSMNAFSPLLPALARRRCVRPELPGAARSSKAYALAQSSPHRGALSVQAHVLALKRVCAALAIPRAHFVGHSFGTIIVQHLAAEDPARVKSLALFGALIEPGQAMRENMRTRAAAAREGKLFEIAEGIAGFALSAHTRETQPVTVAYVRESIASHDGEGLARNCLALAEARAARLELIRCPVLIVNGDEDAVTPLSGARQLAERLADARLEVFSRCGHWPMLERPLESERALSNFLDKVR